MLLQKDSNPALNTVTAYGEHYIEINRVRFDTAICVAPEGAIRSLDIQSTAQIDTALLRELAHLKDRRKDPMAFLDDVPEQLPEDAPEVILIGTGAAQAFLPASTIEPLQALGIGVEAMTTHAAARTYNILISEDRRVLALLLPGGTP
ncbi:MAG: MTH938/NDUFAF3 family protein [Alcaligenaceae bacterium]|nr:MTH938/NDUFAF3 family protein [Alcaligenaceae bacterium]